MKSEKDIMTGKKTAEIVGHAFEEGKEELSEILGDSSIRSIIANQKTRCDNCGSKVRSADDYLVWKCPYCGSTTVLYKGREFDFLKPDYILPFFIDKEYALELIAEWAHNQPLIAPSYEKLILKKENITAEYLPYWMYEAQNASTYCVRQLGRDCRFTSDSGYITRDISHVVYSASAHSPQEQIDQLDKIVVDLIKPYEPGTEGDKPVIRWNTDFTEGFAAVRDKYDKLTIGEIKQQTNKFLRKIIYNNNLWANIRYSQLLIPRWRVEVKFRGKIRRIYINGVTGAIEGSRPPAILVPLILLATILAIIFTILRLIPN